LELVWVGSDPFLLPGKSCFETVDWLLFVLIPELLVYYWRGMLELPMRFTFWRALALDFFLPSASSNSIRLECCADYYDPTIVCGILVWPVPRFENLLPPFITLFGGP